MRMSYKGNTSAFQAEATGSSPVIRSISLSLIKSRIRGAQDLRTPPRGESFPWLSGQPETKEPSFFD